MIRGYSDHAANERTFLAWVRTGIAVIAFGFVIEKFNLFVLTVASSTSAEVAHRLQPRKPVGTARALRRPCSHLRRPHTYRGRNRALRPHRTIAR
jgi:hypothetical protein